MQTKDPVPEVLRLEQLANLVKTGEIKLPKFQRPFVWNEADMLNLLDSIYKGYPIGSILLWNSSQRLNSERSILGLVINTNESNYYPTNYLLDGQQRLTTLCGALFWNGKEENSKWNIYFDLESQTFIIPKSAPQETLFPLNKLINTRDFILQCMKFETHQKKNEFYNRAERLLNAIKDYKIAVVKIGDMTIEEVAPIFERINSTGRKLTIVDLMMAATWSNGFDLTSEINDISSACAEYGFDGIPDQIILRTIAASADLGINKDDIQKLRTKKPDDLLAATRSAKIAILKAINFITSRTGIVDYGYIPYAFQLTYITEFFRINTDVAEGNLSHLEEWFWFTSVTRYFGSTNTGQVTKDLAAMRNYATGKSKRLFTYGEIDISKLFYDKFNLRNASSTTFAALLNIKNPQFTVNEKPIDGGHAQDKNNKFYGVLGFEKNDESKMNIFRVIYPYAKNIGGEITSTPEVLSSNYVSNACKSFIQNGDIIGFIQERSKIIAATIEGLTKCKANFDIPIGTFTDDEVAQSGDY